MKKLKLFFTLCLSIVVLYSCKDEVEAPGTNYITFSSDSYMTGVDPGSTADFDITVYTANVTGADRTFDIDVDGSAAPAGSYTAPASVTVPAGSNEGTLTVSLSDTNLGIGVSTVSFSFVPQAGLSIGGSTSLNYIQNCTEVTATLDIVFDGYGSETGWEVTDALGGVVASKAAGTYADGQASASESITLCAGRDYTFTITDAWGDGLSFPNNGTYTLTLGGVVKASGGGDFGSSESTAFDTK
ncbi:MAG: DUF1735 domain-containing protein [Polaribacter sp.]